MNQWQVAWFSLDSNSKPSFFIFKPSPMELVWKLQILPYNHTHLNSYSGRSRQERILGKLSFFSKQV
jgi:hypothetical protein